MIHVRSAESTDLVHLKAIQQSALSEFAPSLLDGAVHGAIDSLVAVDDSPVGYSLFLDADGTPLLLELAVSPDRQNEGIGSTLLEKTCTHLESTGHRNVQLTVQQSNTRALRFYERHDFEKRETIPELFESDDGILFVREL